MNALNLKHTALMNEARRPWEEAIAIEHARYRAEMHRLLGEMSDAESLQATINREEHTAAMQANTRHAAAKRICPICHGPQDDASECD